MPKQEPGSRPRPSGPECAGSSAAGPEVWIHGLPKVHCAAHGLRVRIHVVADGKLTSVVVRLNGRRVVRTRRARFVLRVPAARLANGTNRLVVEAVDDSGRRGTRRARFRRC